MIEESSRTDRIAEIIMQPGAINTGGAGRIGRALSTGVDTGLALVVAIGVLASNTGEPAATVGRVEVDEGVGCGQAGSAGGSGGGASSAWACAVG